MSRELAKRSVLAVLKEHLPGVLARRRIEHAAAQWPWPFKPDDPRRYGTASRMPADEASYPCVLIMEHGSAGTTFLTAEGTGGHRSAYVLVLMLGARALGGDVEQAETQRDRLVDAVLEVLHTRSAGVHIDRQSIEVQTGLAADSGALASTAAAEITLTVTVDDKYPEPGVAAEHVTTQVHAHEGELA